MLSRALAVLLVINMTVMFALPIGIFAEDITIIGGNVSAEYGEDSGEATDPSGSSGTSGDQSDGGGIFQIFDFGTMAVKTAGTWAELRDAISTAAAGDTIQLLGNITRQGGITNATDLPVITKNLTIDGTNPAGGVFTLDFRNDGASTVINRVGIKVAANVTFTLKNVNIIRPNISNLNTYSGTSISPSNDNDNYAGSDTSRPAYALIGCTSDLTGNSTGAIDSAGGSNFAYSASITVNIENVTGISPEEGGAESAVVRGGIATIPYGTVNFKGNNTWITYVSSRITNANRYRLWERIVNARTITFDGGTHVLKSGGQAIRSNAPGGISLSVTNGADVSIYARTLQAISLRPGKTVGTANIYVANGSSLDLVSDGWGHSEPGATVVVEASGGGYTITGGSKFSIKALCGIPGQPFTNGDLGQPALIQQIVNGTFNISGEGTEMYVESNGFDTYEEYGAAMRFREANYPTFNVSDKAKVRIVKDLPSGTANDAPPALRFGLNSANPTFNVWGGATIDIENHAGTAAGSNTDNNGIDFDTSTFAFNIWGDHSAVSIVADNGPAISSSRDGTITLGNNTADGKNSIFVAQGRTASATSGIFKAGKLTFSANEPLYYNFVNTRAVGATGGRIFDVTTNSTFTSTKSDAAFWRNGADHSGSVSGSTSDRLNSPLTGDPFRMWTGLTYKVTGIDFGTFKNADSDDATFNTTAPSFGDEGFEIYSRVNGNNANPVITDRGLTNADKTVRFYGTVEEGLPDDPDRGLWTGEAYGRFTHNGGTVQSLVSLLNDSYEVETANPPLTGVLKLANSGPGTFLMPGDTYTLTSAWRGLEDNPNNLKNHMAQNVPYTVTVTDVLPPDPVVLTSHTNGGNIWTDQRTITGTYTNMAPVTHNSEPVTRIFAALNGVEVPGSTFTLNPDLTFTLTLPDTMSWIDGDKLSIIAEDSNGNQNPIVNTPKRDTTLAAAPSLTVKIFPVDLSADDAAIGLTRARDVKGDGDPTGVAERLEALINARAAIKPGKEADWPSGNLGVTVSDDGGFAVEITNFDRATWISTYGLNYKDYTITYWLDGDHSYTKQATVRVHPYDEFDGVAANNFEISLNSAILLNQKSTAARDLELIERADATAYEGVINTFPYYTGTQSPANVVVVSSGIQNAKGTYPVVFAMKNAPARTIPIYVTVIDGNFPVLTVDSPVEIWIGDPAAKPADALLPSQFDPTNSDAYKVGVSALNMANGANITSAVTHNGLTNPVNIEKKGLYPVTYRVENDENNAIEATRVYVVNDGSYRVVRGTNNYILHAQSFVVKQADANTSNILTNSGAAAWKINQAQIGSGTENVSFEISGNNGYTVGAAPGSYDVMFRVVGVPTATQSIKAVVTNLGVLGGGEVASTAARYAIAANNVQLRPSEVAARAGMSASATQLLISDAKAQGWRLTNLATDASIVVVRNDIPTNALQNAVYDVVFAITDDINRGINITVKFTIMNDAPVITGQEDPLVIPQQAASVAHDLTADELKAGMTVWDAVDQNLLAATQVVVPGGSALPTINTYNVGVYQIEYKITDSDGAESTALRAVVIQDERYRIEKADNIIIGAQNFVAAKGDVSGLIDQVRSWSCAEAFTINGTSIPSVNLTVQSIPPGYGGNPNTGNYPFTWQVAGHTTTKSITGYIVDATKVHGGSKNVHYAIAASNFTRNLEGAAAIIAADSYAGAANAQVFRLVDALAMPTVNVQDRGGFAAVQGPYNIVFNVYVNGVPLVVAVNESRPEVTIVGTVSQGNEPLLSVSSPVEVAPNGNFDPMAGVVATDEEAKTPANPTGDITGDVQYNAASYAGWTETVNPVDVTTVGLYPMKYWVTDSDNNTTPGKRLVVVNDGSYKVGVTRVLFGSSFVTKLSDVTTDSSLIEAQIVSRSRAAGYNDDGTYLGPNGVSVSSAGGYGRNVREYPITLQHADGSNPVISKDIRAKVVDADELSPGQANRPGATTWVYGKHADLTISEATTIVAGGDNALLTRLSAGATITQPGGALTPGSVKIDSVTSDNGATSFSDAVDTYRVTVTDTANQNSVVLRVRVGTGKTPVVTALPKPLSYPIASTPGSLSTAQIMSGVTATDEEAKSAQNPDGSIIERVTYVIRDVTAGAPGTIVANIPANQAGVYQVTYSATDVDGNTDSDSRAVIVNDGRYYVAPEYILAARSFVVALSDVSVSTPEAQILALAGAGGWNLEGTPQPVEVSQIAGYNKALGYWHPIIIISGHADVSKEVEAFVFNDGDAIGDTNGVNGTRYALLATNFRMNLTDANALAQQSAANIAATFINKSVAGSFDRTGSALLSASAPTLVNDGGFVTSAPYAAPTTLTLRMAVADEPGTFVDVKLFISNATPPQLTVPPSKKVALNASLDDAFYRTGASATDSEDGDLTPFITYNASAVNTAVKGVYPVTYSVTDKDYNTVSGTTSILVDFIGDKDYAVSAYSFVKPAADVTGTSEILATSRAEALLVRSNDPAEMPLIPKPTTARIRANLDSYGNTAKDYNIEIGVIPEAPHEGDPYVSITAKVVTQNGIATDNDATASTHYAVVANKVVEIAPVDMNNYVGDTNAVYTRLIAAAEADGYRFDAPRETAPGVGVSDLTDINAVVKTNGIVNPVAGGEYNVVFTPTGQSNVELTVKFRITMGQKPVITFTENPLVIQQQTPGHNMTVAELRDKMEVIDAEDGNLLSSTSAIPVSGGAINTHSIGVYKVNYSVTDSQGQTTTASRLVVIDDGRYSYIDDDGTAGIDVIIGARNFVAASSQILTGSVGEVRSFSYARAYDNKTGDELVTTIATMPANWGPRPAERDYDFVWSVQGHPTATKGITGFIRNADVIDPGSEDGQYGLIAWHFDANLDEAAAIYAGGDTALLGETRAAVIKLVDSADDRNPRISDRGTWLPLDPADRQGDYNIKISVTGLPDDTPTVTAIATVSQGKIPELTVPTPLTVWIGAQNDPQRTPGSILPGDYNNLYGISAEDEEDGPLTGAVQVLPTSDTVDLTKVGLYHLDFSVTDSDNNTVYGERVVVVNDGRIIVGEGRILVANGYVVQSTTVAQAFAAGTTAVRNQVVGLSGAEIFDAKTGVGYGSANVTVFNYGGYSATPNTDTPPNRAYTITLNAPDYPFSGTLVKNIDARVVGATVIDDGPKPHDPMADTTYIYGTNATLRPSEVQDLLDAANTDAAVIEALGAGADVTTASGAVSKVDVRIDSITPALAIARGIYTVKVSDVNGVTSINLTITVGEGNFPTIEAPKPVVVAWSAASGNLTRAELLDGTFRPKSNTTWAVTADDIEDGNITGNIVITDPATGDFPQIPRNVVGIYQVRYSVVDADNNPASLTRAVVVDDGNVVYNDEYILNAASFLIGVSEVDTLNRNTQILNRSGAVAAQTDGTRAQTWVPDPSGYSNDVRDYSPVIGIVGYDMTKTITAKVYDDGNGDGDNGNIYSLYAQNFRINIADANALKAQVGTPAYAQAFIDKSKTKSYLRNTSNLADGGTPALATNGDGGFATRTFEQPTLPDGSVNPAYPTRVPITIWVDEERTTTVTIDAIVSNGSYPTLTAPGPKAVALNASLNDAFYRDGASANDGEDGDITAAITYDASAVNTSVKDIYPVTYAVVDSEGNSATAVAHVAVDMIVDKDYIADAYSFVRLKSDVTGTPTEILAASYAKAWLAYSNDPAEQAQLPQAAIATVKVNDDPYKNEVGEYNIETGVIPVAPHEGDPRVKITAKVVDQTGIASSTSTDAASSLYSVVADRVVNIEPREANNYVGNTGIVNQYLIAAARAEGYRFDAPRLVDPTDPRIGKSDLVPIGATVKSNGIVNPVAGGDYNVVFTPAGQPDIELTVRFHVTMGSYPEIFFDSDPLVIAQTTTNHNMTPTELKAAMRVVDIEDGDLKENTSAIPVSGGAINTHSIGVYKVNYSVTDSQNQTKTASRLVVITDGRYTIVDEDNDGDNDIIIGARNFVATSSQILTGSEGEVGTFSYAEAYDNTTGNELVVHLVSVPGGWGPSPSEGNYRFTWYATGHPTVTKEITGIIRDAHHIDPGTKDSQYALVAWDFDANLEEARTIYAGGDPALITQTRAEVIPLLDGLPVLSPTISGRDGFLPLPTDPEGTNQQGIYNITIVATGPNVTVVPSVTAVATVSQGKVPVLTVPTPVTVWIGAQNDPDRTPGSILPNQYTDDKYAITAYDEEDRDITSRVQVLPTSDTVDLTTVGLYHLNFSVTDLDNNTVYGERTVVVNDGRYVVGQGRILLANGYVIQSSLVKQAVDAGGSALRDQVIGRSTADVFDAKTGAALGSTNVIVNNYGGYADTPVPRDYTITLNAPDYPSGTLVKNITARVVGATVIDEGPEDPRNPTIDTTYVYGDNAIKTPSEMQDIINGGDSAVIAALNGFASRTTAKGTVVNVSVKVKGITPALSTNYGVYRVTLADVDDIASIELTISVGTGNFPVIEAPEPVVVALNNTPGNLTRAELLDGTFRPKSNTVWAVTANDLEDGDITDDIVITDPITGAFPQIPRNIVGVYQVRYSVVDADGNPDEVLRAVVVDDGTVVYDDRYVLIASSFLIGSSEVDFANRNAQILARSGARATTTRGVPAATQVLDPAGYNSSPHIAYRPLIGINGYNMTKYITAKVYNDGDGDDGGNGTNGNIYSIEAGNFRINITDANALKAQVGTPTYAQTFITKSDVKSYLRNTSMLNEGGTPALATGGDGGFSTTTFEQPTLPDGSVNPAYPTRVPITFWVDEERETTVTIDAIVSNGDSPRLNVPSIKEISLNDSFTDADYLIGVSATDSEDGDITSQVQFNKPVNPAERGLYKINYSVTDSEGNSTAAVGFVAVDLFRSGDYVIDAFSFVKLSQDVTGTDAEILAASYAKAQRIRSNDPDEFDLLPIDVPVIVMDNDGYSDVVDEYTVRLGVEPELGYSFPDDRKALYTAKVIDRHKIAIDADTSAKVHYAVAANNVTISLAEVGNYVGLGDVAKTYLKTAAAAVAFRLTTGLATNDVDVVANGITSGAAEGDVFDVTFSVRDVPSVAVTVQFTIDNDPAPVILIDGPLIKPATATSYILYAEDLMEGVTARDQQSPNGPFINLTSSVEVTGPSGARLPVIDTSKPGVYVVEYSVTDSAGKTAIAGRTVVVNDGRYEFVDEDGDNSVDTIIGAKSYVVKRGILPASDPAKLTQAKELSWLEAYSWTGEDLTGQARLADSDGLLVDLPLDYRNAVLGRYPLIWTIPGHPLVAKPIVAEILADDYRIYPAPDSSGLIDKTTPYVIVAHDFSVNSTIAANINADEHYINRADARIIQVVGAAPAKSTLVLNNGGFSTTPGTYQVTFADDRVAPKFQITINAAVTNGSLPTLVYPKPIVIPIRADGSADIDKDMLLNLAGILATDHEAVEASNPSGNITSYVQILDARTGQEISLSSDLPDVHQVIIRVKDSDDNLVEAKVAVVIDDGHFVISGDYILRAEDFVINIDDVQESSPNAQITAESGLQAWRTDGELETATVIETGGYRKDTQGGTSYDYVPTVGVGGIRIPIKATVIDTHPRYRVEFNANGGTLLGPSAINIVDSNTLLYMPVSPIRNGYTFRQWVTANGVQFTASTPLTSPVTTVYATWDEVPATPPPTPQQPPTVIVNNPPATGGSTTYVTVPPGNDTETSTLPDEPTPGSGGTENLPDPNTPGGAATTVAGWSLFNLLATIFSLIMLVVFFIKFFFDRPRDEEYEEEPIDAQLWEAMTPDQRAQYQARREADYQAWMADREKKAHRQKVLVVNAPVLLIVGVALVEALVVLLNTQTFGPNMKAVDDWSVLFALILFVQLLTPMVAAMIRNSRKERLDRQEATSQPATSDSGVTL